MIARVQRGPGRRGGYRWRCRGAGTGVAGTRTGGYALTRVGAPRPAARAPARAFFASVCSVSVYSLPVHCDVHTLCYLYYP